MSAPKASAFSVSPSMLGVVKDQRVEVAVAGMEDIGDAQAVLFGELAHSREYVAQLLARDGAVHAEVVGSDCADCWEGVLAAGPELQSLGFACRRHG